MKFPSPQELIYVMYVLGALIVIFSIIGIRSQIKINMLRKKALNELSIISLKVENINDLKDWANAVSEFEKWLDSYNLEYYIIDPVKDIFIKKAKQLVINGISSKINR